MSTQVASLRLHRLTIPLKTKFAHAAAERNLSETLVVQIELGNGVTGFGETIPRSYVSGETVDGAVSIIQEVFIERLLSLRPERFMEAVEFADELPFFDDVGCPIHAARAAVELALLDAYGKHFRRKITDISGWLGLARYAPPGSTRRVRYSGVVSSGEPEKVRRSIRMMRLYGLRDFKLKLGRPDDIECVEAAVKSLGRGLIEEKFTLRADVNGAWSTEEAIDRFDRLKDRHLSWIEQPLSKEDLDGLSELRRHGRIPIVVDESLISVEQAEELISRKACDGFNIRISKNGGLIPSLRLAHLAESNGLAYQLGCMVGETSILSAAGRAFLEIAPSVQFAEGSYGRRLLVGDVTRKPVQFGWGGAIKPLTGDGLGVDVDKRLIDRHKGTESIAIPI
jgi:muconate cycloisomerase